MMVVYQASRQRSVVAELLFQGDVRPMRPGAGRQRGAAQEAKRYREQCEPTYHRLILDEARSRVKLFRAFIRLRRFSTRLSKAVAANRKASAANLCR